MSGAHFIDGLRSQMAEIQQRGKQLIKQDIRFQKIRKIGLNPRQEEAVRHLIKTGKITVNEYQSVALCKGQALLSFRGLLLT